MRSCDRSVVLDRPRRWRFEAVLVMSPSVVGWCRATYEAALRAGCMRRSPHLLGRATFTVGGSIDRERVRLAELLAALSLGIDLGFGQPMEHVLRQCRIALRIGELVGLDEDERGRRLLLRAAGQRRLPHRRPRAGALVRRRHRHEGDQVRRTSRSAPRDMLTDAPAARVRAARRCTGCGSASTSPSPAARSSTG